MAESTKHHASRQKSKFSLRVSLQAFTLFLILFFAGLLDQIGILADVDYLHQLLDLLCDLADEVEQQSYGKLLSKANKIT